MIIPVYHAHLQALLTELELDPPDNMSGEDIALLDEFQEAVMFAKNFNSTVMLTGEDLSELQRLLGPEKDIPALIKTAPSNIVMPKALPTSSNARPDLTPTDKN